MEHNYWEEQLHAYLDDELGPADYLAFQDHMQDCEDCRQAYGYYGAMKSRLKAHRDLVEMPEDTEERLSRLARNPKTRRFRKLGLWTAIIASAAAAILLFFRLPAHGKDLYHFKDGVLRGEIVCHDCEVSLLAGLDQMRLCAGGHHLGLKTDQGELWRFAATQEGLNYVNDMSLAHKRVEVVGAMLQNRHIIMIQRVAPLNLQHSVTLPAKLPQGLYAADN